MRKRRLEDYMEQLENRNEELEKSLQDALGTNEKLEKILSTTKNYYKSFENSLEKMYHRVETIERKNTLFPNKHKRFYEKMRKESRVFLEYIKIKIEKQVVEEILSSFRFALSLHGEEQDV